MLLQDKPLQPSNLFASVCEKIVEEIQVMPREDGSFRRRVFGKEKTRLRKSVEKFVRDSVSIRFKTSTGYASVHKNANDYSNGRMGKQLSYKITVVRAFEGMVGLGYLRVTQQGASNGTHGRYLTRYEATLKLMAEFASVDAEILPVLIPPDLDEHPVRIRLSSWKVEGGKRFKEVKKLPTPDTYQVTTMVDNLRVINEALVKNWPDLDITDEDLAEMQDKMKKSRGSQTDKTINLSKRILYRVFNDEAMTRGGRFYGAWWQNIPSEYRSNITINGKPMVECDYSGLHPSILYAERNLKPLIDPYAGIVDARSSAQHDQKKARDAAKKIFNAMLNAKQPMKSQPEGVKLSDFDMKWKEASHRVLELHKPILECFYSDSGARLQRIDADMAEEIMMHFVTKGTIVLPVQDSFLVHSGYESELKKVMTEAFQGRFGILPGLKWKIRSIRPEELLDKETSQEIEEVLETMAKGDYKRLTAHFEQKRGP